MTRKSVHSQESTNTLRKFIRISFPSKSQDHENIPSNDHEDHEANTRTSENILDENIPSNDQTPHNNISPTDSSSQPSSN